MRITHTHRIQGRENHSLDSQAEHLIQPAHPSSPTPHPCFPTTKKIPLKEKTIKKKKGEKKSFKSPASLTFIFPLGYFYLFDWLFPCFLFLLFFNYLAMANSFTARTWPIPWAEAAWTWLAGEGGGIWIPFGGADPSSAWCELGGGSTAAAAHFHRGQPGVDGYAGELARVPPPPAPSPPGTAGMQHRQRRDGSLLQWWVLSTGLSSDLHQRSSAPAAPG